LYLFDVAGQFLRGVVVAGFAVFDEVVVVFGDVLPALLVAGFAHAYGLVGFSEVFAGDVEF
jgi:hypothetical protein